MTDALDRVVQLVGETRMDARPGDRRADLVGGCQILCPVILVGFGFVFVQALRKKLPWRVALPSAVNLVANLIFTALQFGMRHLPLAAVDILVVWATNIWNVVAVWRHYRWVAVAQGPYFVWVSPATVLQLSVTAMNWGR